VHLIAVGCSRRRQHGAIGSWAVRVGCGIMAVMAMRSRPRQRWWRPWLRWLRLAVVLWLAVTFVLVGLLRFVDPPTSSFMAQRVAGAWWHDEADFQLRHRWRPLDEIAPAMWLAVVASEDQTFPDHHGFDFQALRKVAAEHLAGDGSRGGSTISQQTAKNLFLWPGRSWFRKGVEAYFTVLIEALWPKRRILEVYLNIAQFGRDEFGVEGAAQAFFGVPAAALSAEQAARLAAVLPAPNRYRAQPPGAHVRERAAWIQAQMRALGGPAHLDRLNPD
jgi:monofunctional biosynthetic peptidoglycan transglycosylase